MCVISGLLSSWLTGTREVPGQPIRLSPGILTIAEQKGNRANLFQGQGPKEAISFSCPDLRSLWFLSFLKPCSPTSYRILSHPVALQEKPFPPKSLCLATREELMASIFLLLPMPSFSSISLLGEVESYKGKGLRIKVKN